MRPKRAFKSSKSLAKHKIAIISEATVISKNKAKSMMIINYDTTSSYYVLTWEKDTINGQWKILDVAEKK